MLGKTKEIGSRYASSTDFTRVVHKAFELLNSSSPDSDQELLELVKKAKREGDKDPLPNPKKVRTGLRYITPGSVCWCPLYGIIPQVCGLWQVGLRESSRMCQL